MSDAAFDTASPARIQEFNLSAQPSPDAREALTSLLGLPVVVQRGDPQEGPAVGLAGSATRLAEGIANAIAADPQLARLVRKSMDCIVLCAAERDPAYELRDRTLRIFRSTMRVDAQRCAAIAQELFRDANTSE